jgi:uncharacterized protein (TIGR00299 family) protein
VHVRAPESTTTRTWADVRAILTDASLPTAVRDGAMAVFERLAVAEGRVHRMDPEAVHFHEVGALDALADVVGVVAGFEHLGLDELTASPVTVGSGSVGSAHGALPVPAPAVLELLKGVPIVGGPLAAEMSTPTGAALVRSRVRAYGPLPPMTVLEVGVGAGGRDPAELPNVARLVVGMPHRAPDVSPVVLETNVDDLDPRLWPGVLDALLAAGASDAWLTPILMKKGRPAHTLSALCPRDAVPAVENAIFATTSTIGLRVVAVGKVALERAASSVEVLGGRVGVKLARHDGRLVNVSVEYEDVAALARDRGLPVKDVLRAASAAAQATHPLTS